MHFYPAFGRDFRGGGGAGQITKVSYNVPNGIRANGTAVVDVTLWHVIRVSNSIMNKIMVCFTVLSRVVNG